MLKKFLPDIYQESIFTIDYEKLKQKNIKYLLFDLDNTISPAKEVVLDEKIKELFNKLKKDFTIILFSNNTEKRVKVFANFYEVDCLYLSLKPFGYKYRRMLNIYNCKKEEVASIGDQLMTDILGGNRADFTTILVDPICEIDAKETYINRSLEKQILKQFSKRKMLKKGKYYD